MTLKPAAALLAAVLLAAALLAGCMSTAPAPQGPGGPPAVITATAIGCTPVTITQTDGKEVTLPCRPQRIIVANAGAAEMLVAFGAADRIVGVSDSTRNVTYIMDRIPGAKNIGSWQTPNVEAILALRPDAVISYSSYKPKNLDQLTAAGITVVSIDCYRLDTLASDARALGRLTGRTNEAEVYARMVEDTVAEVRARVKKISEEDIPAVYFEGYTDFTASANGSGSGEMLTLAGGKNIAGDMVPASSQVSPEWVVSRQPRYILKAVSSSNTRTLPEIVAGLKARPGWSSIVAVREDRVYAISSEIGYGPRAYIGLVWIAQLLHPDEFRDLHPRQMLAEYESRYVAGTNRTTVIYP